jgi:hypothetical protein
MAPTPAAIQGMPLDLHKQLLYCTKSSVFGLFHSFVAMEPIDQRLQKEWSRVQMELDRHLTQVCQLRRDIPMRIEEKWKSASNSILKRSLHDGLDRLLQEHNKQLTVKTTIIHYLIVI